MLKWRKDVGLEECRKGIEELFTLIKENNLNKCLINTCHRGILSAEAEEWELSMLQSDDTSFVPEGLHVALVMSDSKYKQMIHEYSLNRVCKFNLPITINYFTQINEAVDWLEHDTPSNSL
ncbi:hypothetical protein [Rufibacter latericius]|nr:hypothetical protein [Rufibacter latericius]